MTLSSSAAAFRIVEIAAILLPLVLVLLQVSIQYYRGDDVETRPFEQGIILVSIGVAGVGLASAASSSIGVLVSQDYSAPVQNSLDQIQGVFFFLAVPVAFIVFAAVTDLGDGDDPPDRTVSLPGIRIQTGEESNAHGIEGESEATEDNEHEK